MLGMVNKLEQHLDLSLNKLGIKLPLSLSIHALAKESHAHAFTASFNGSIVGSQNSLPFYCWLCNIEVGILKGMFTNMLTLVLEIIDLID
jgi:hypothetical protein